jgi:hypothetical protein
MKLKPIPVVKSWLTGEPKDKDMSKPTLTDWYEHIPTYGGVAIMMAIQTCLLLILLLRRK